MKRDLAELSRDEFDVLVIGGGAAGAACAREACLRGFKTALVERDDFGAGTSAHCFKVVHGGIRYLQHLDIPRMRASCRERATLLRLAPHLVSPLPFVVPTFGRGKGSRWFLGTGMLAYDLFTQDSNRLIADPSRRIRGTRFLGRSDVLSLFPHIDPRRLTGAAVFEDGQMYSPQRLVLAFVSSAAAMGASVANHVEAERLLLSGARVIGASVRDTLTGQSLDIRAKLVINAAGPWAEGILGGSRVAPEVPGTYSRDACFVLARRPKARMALAIQGRTRDSDALIARNARHMFLVPWRDSTLVGVWHQVTARDPDGIHLSREELRGFMQEINECCPAIGLNESEITMTGYGLVPFGKAAQKDSGSLSFGKQSRIIDHRAVDGTGGLVSLISVRYTVARRDAVATVNVIEEQLGRRASGHLSCSQPLAGGAIENFSAFRRAIESRLPRWIPRDSAESLTQNYGSDVDAIFALGENNPDLQRCLQGSLVSHAEVVHAIRNEMASTLNDIVFRRTELGTAAQPPPAALVEVQDLMSRELNWSKERAARERHDADTHLRRFLAGPSPHLTVSQPALVGREA
jgi:glycerol-3-phosphate dehydrogenase